MVVVDTRGMLQTDQYLRTDQYIVSPNGSFYAVMQGDGNFCVYKGTGPSDNRGYLWGAGVTAAGHDFFAAMQSDGNFCVYKGTGPLNNHGLLWQANVKQEVGPLYTLCLLDNGNLVVRDGVVGGRPIWQSGPTATPGTNFRIDQSHDAYPSSVASGKDYWQSFVPAIDGTLVRLDLLVARVLAGATPPQQALLRIYEGQGIAGAALYEGPASWAQGPSGSTYRELSSNAPLVAGRTYSWRLTDQLGATSLRFTEGAAHPEWASAMDVRGDGHWQPSGAAFFKTWVRPAPPIWIN